MKETIDLEYRVGWNGKGYWEMPRPRHERLYFWVQDTYFRVRNWVKSRVYSLYESLLGYATVGKKEEPFEPISYEKSSVLEEKLIGGEQQSSVLPPVHKRLLLSAGVVEEKQENKEDKKETLKGQEVYPPHPELAFEQKAYSCKEKERELQALGRSHLADIIGDGLAGARLIYFEAFCRGRRIKGRWWDPRIRSIYRREKKRWGDLGFGGFQLSFFAM